MHIESAEMFSTVRAASEQLLDRASPALARTVRHAVSLAAAARRGTKRFASLLLSDGIVARRYTGTLGDAEGPVFGLLFVGREEFAREFELYFGQNAGHRIDPEATLFRGNLAQYSLQKKGRLVSEAASADLVACEVLPGVPSPSPSTEGELFHYPMLEGSLHVERSLDQQLRRVRSRSQRRLMREILGRDAYHAWDESGPQAFDTFYESLHAPYARARFGLWTVDDTDQIRQVYARHGRILFVAPRARASEPVCGTLLLDGDGRVLTYRLNGFASDSLRDSRLLAERTAAVELAMMRHAIEHRYERIDVGYARAILSDGLFTHKRRLGCNFALYPGSPAFRVSVRATRRAAVFARFPMLGGEPGAWTVTLGYDDAAPRTSKKTWRGRLKSYRMPGIAKVIVWTNAKGERVRDAFGELAFREAILETFDVPDGVEFRADE